MNDAANSILAAATVEANNPATAPAGNAEPTDQGGHDSSDVPAAAAPEPTRNNPRGPHNTPNPQQHPPRQHSQNQRQQQPRQAQGGAQAGARGGKKVHPVLEQLFTLYPSLFGAQFLPLKLGVFQDLMAQNPELFSKDDMKVALGLHARSTRYLESVATGHPRHDLTGTPVEPVAPEHVHHAIMETFKRRQNYSRDDLRPQLVARLVAAVETSGLTCDQYSERVRSQNEEVQAVLNEALTQAKAQAARREALLRAFDASGSSETEFASMYGMPVAEVAATLARARADLAATKAAEVAAAEATAAAAAAATDTAEIADAGPGEAPAING